jgi:hypothetical protein
MEEVITYVGIDAHTRESHVAMLIGAAATPVTWDGRERPEGDRATAPQARARRARPRPGVLRSGAVRLCAAAAADEGACRVAS